MAVGHLNDGSHQPEAELAERHSATELLGKACVPQALPLWLLGLPTALPMAAGTPRHTSHGVLHGVWCSSKQPAAISSAAEYLI